MGTSTSATQKPNQNQSLAKSDEAALRINGASRDAKDVTTRLQYAAKHFHLVSPMTSCGAVPEGCSIALSTIVIDAENETSDVGGGKFGLGKSALNRIASAAGISWVSEKSGRLDDGSNPHYVMWRAIGKMRHLDGTVVELMGTKEMDLREKSAQVDALFERFESKHAAWDRAGRRSYEPKSPEGQIREMRLHIVGHAETKAQLRAIRTLGIRSAYKKEELAKPFVVAKIMWTGQSDDPELRRAFAMKQADAMIGGHQALYGASPVQGPGFGAAPPTLHTTSPPQLGGRRPPPVGQSFGHDHDGDDEAIDVPAKPPSEPKPRQRAKQNTPPPPADSGPTNAAPPGDGPTCRFGKTKGEPIMNMSDDDLSWYRGALEANVADPDKSRFKASNEAHLKEVLAEVSRRNGDALADSESDDDGDDRGDNPENW